MKDGIVQEDPFYWNSVSTGFHEGSLKLVHECTRFVNLNGLWSSFSLQEYDNLDVPGLRGLGPQLHFAQDQCDHGVGLDIPQIRKI